MGFLYCYMHHNVNIPNVDRDDRIGSAFNHLFRVVMQTESHPDDELIWNLKDSTFFHPFYLAPLSIYKQSMPSHVKCINIPLRISGYLDLVHFENPLLITEGMGLDTILEPYVGRSYIPICKFELCRSNIDGLQSILQKVILRQSHSDSRIVSPSLIC